MNKGILILFDFSIDNGQSGDWKKILLKLYSCRNVQNKPIGRFCGDVFNQMYILILVLSNTNISTNTNFEQIMVDFSINWLCKVFHQANFGLGFKEFGIDFEQALWLANWHQKTDKGYWTVEGSTMWYSSKDNKIKSKILSKILSNSTRLTEVQLSPHKTSPLTWMTSKKTTFAPVTQTKTWCVLWWKLHSSPWHDYIINTFNSA